MFLRNLQTMWHAPSESFASPGLGGHLCFRRKQ